MAPGNSIEILKQWLNLHGLTESPMSEGMVDGYPHQVWWNGDGETVVESYSITDMAHGTPLGLTDDGDRFGAPGAHMLEAGISSSYHIAQFFGLTDAILQPKSALVDKPAGTIDADVDVSPLVHVAGDRRAEPRQTSPRGRAIDVNAVITRALTAAGLLK